MSRPIHIRPRKPRRLQQLLVLGVLGVAVAAALALLPADPDDAGFGDGVRGPGESAGEAGAAHLRGNAHARSEGGGARVAGSALVGRVLRGVTGVPAVVELRRLHDLLTRHRPDPGPFDEGYPPSREDLLANLGHSRRVASALTDLEGRFTLPIPGPGVYDVRALATDGATVRREVVVGVRREQVRITLDLPNGGETLRGSVIYEDGRPFTGQLLVERGRESTHWSVAGSAGWLTVVDARGAFTMRGLPSGSLALSVLDPGRLRLTNIPVVLPRKNALTITIPTSLTCEGRVVDAATHEPINGAHVTVVGYAWTGRTILVHTTSDATGGFRVCGPAIASKLSVEAAGYTSTELALLVASASPLVLGLERGGEVRGRLVAEGSGEPVAGVRVYLVRAWHAPLGARHRMTRSDASGAFAFEGLVPGDASVFAVGAGWVSTNLSEEQAGTPQALLVSIESERTTNLDLVVLPTCRLAGTVRDVAGVPASGAEVLALPTGERARGTISRLYELDIATMRCLSTADGTYALDNLIPESAYRVRATGADAATAEQLMTAGGAGATSTVDLVLEAPASGWTLDVTVVSSTGEPLAGAVIETASRVMDRHWSEGAGRWTTDARGRARVGPLTASQVGIRARATDHVPPDPWESDPWTLVTRDGEVAEAAATLVLDRGASLAGRVVGPPGAPLERVALVIDPGLDWTRAVTLAAVDHDGQWSLPGGLSSRRIDLYAVLRWNGHTYHTEVSAEPGSQDVRVVLEEQDDLFPGSMEASGARIFDPQGRPATRGRAAIHEEGDRYWGHSATPITSGRASFHKYIRKPYYIEVWGGPGDLWGAGRFGPFEPEELEPEIHLGPAHSIAGVLRDPAGRPQAGVCIVARHPGYVGSASYDRQEIAYAETATDPEGRFTLRGLGTAEYELEVRSPSTHEPVPAQIVRGGTHDVEIILYSAVRAEVRIVDPEGRPVSGGWVKAEAKQPGSNVREGVTDHFDTQGVARLLGLTEGTEYDLHVHPPGGDDGPFLSHVQKRWKPEATTVQLARAYSISGRVLDLTGTPLGGMQIYARTGGQRRASAKATTSADGTFSIERIPKGRYQLWTLPEGVQTVRPVDVWIFAEAGSQGVVLAVDPGLELIVHVEGWPEDHGAVAEMRTDASQHVWYARIETNDPRTLRFRGVPEDLTHSVWIRNPRGGHSFRAFGHRLRAGQVVTLTAREAAPIAVRLLFPEDVRVHSRSVRAKVERFSFYAGSKPSGGEARIKGVPDGVWPLRASVEDARGRKWRGEGTASPGSRIDIVMRLDTD